MKIFGNETLFQVSMDFTLNRVPDRIILQRSNGSIKHSKKYVWDELPHRLQIIRVTEEHELNIDSLLSLNFQLLFKVRH